MSLKNILCMLWIFLVYKNVLRSTIYTLKMYILAGQRVLCHLRKSINSSCQDLYLFVSECVYVWTCMCECWGQKPKSSILLCCSLSYILRQGLYSHPTHSTLASKLGFRCILLYMQRDPSIWSPCLEVRALPTELSPQSHICVYWFSFYSHESPRKECWELSFLSV